MDTPLSTATVATEFVESLNRHGIEYVFSNAGTDFAPVIEALVAMQGQGAKMPRFQAVPHENLAVAMAHSYYAISGKPAAVMVHTTVGTANAAMGVLNAARDNIPLLLLAGRTPLTQAGHVASRNAHIHWGQESFDQGGMFREYLKWDYELRAGQPVDDILGRALELAITPPCGPVYLTLPREVLADAASGVAPDRFAPVAVAPEPADYLIEELATAVANARLPIFVTSHSGQDQRAVDVLESVAEEFAIPVVQPLARYVNLRSDHPMHGGFDVSPWLKEADLIVVFDCEMPWVTSREAPAAGARVVHMGLQPAFGRYPYRVFTSDLNIVGSPRAGLAKLQRALAGSRKQMAAGIAERRTRMQGFIERQRNERAAMLDSVKAMNPIAPAWMGECIGKALPDDAIVINELGVPTESFHFTRPGSFINAGMAGGLGFGLGGALGAKLASPDRFVAVTLGNGSYMFGNPTPFHYMSQAMNLPVLTVIQNNSRWQAVDVATRAVYPSGHSAAVETPPLVDLSPSPEFTLVAQASGAFAEKVTDPAQLPDALARAVAAVQEGRQALLDVRTGVKGPRQG